MSSEHASRSSIQLIAPPALRSALKRAAARRMTTASEYARQAILEKLRADDLDPVAIARTQAAPVEAAA
jgi:hypothetical protein